MGWTDGMNELPFVLVEDCARAIVCALEPDAAVAGRTDNIVGGVRITARDYLEELARALGRPLRFHAGRVWRMQGVEIAKWLVKRAGGRAVPFPAVRDLQSRGMRARFDTSDTERALKWEPVRDRARFIESGIRVPAKAYRLD
jgi:nucleoside-diphosphate-sugar epimerase